MMMIERLHQPTASAFRRDYLGKRPVIMTGLFDHWRARSWTPDYFERHVPAAPVRVEQWDGDESTDDPIEFFNEKQSSYLTTMGDLVTRIRETRPTRSFYAAGVSLQDLPALSHDIQPLDDYMGLARHPLASRLKMTPRLWFGPAGALSTLHFDRCQNFMATLFGKKRWIIIPPEDSELVYYPSPALEDVCMHMSPVDIERPDLARYPKSAHAQRIEVITEPGDLIYIPPRWWHHVRSLEPSIGLNFFWYLPIANTWALRSYFGHLVARKLGRALGAVLGSPTRG